MTVQRIRIAGDPVLHTPARRIDTFDDELRALVADMFETMYLAEGVGLAANQIGVGLRVFVYDCPDADGGWHIGTVVNPTVHASEAVEDGDEGCLSVPGERFLTARGARATVTGFDLDGAPITLHGTGTLARCFQHETDHLDGLLYLDRLTGETADEAKQVLATRGWSGPGRRSWQPEPPESFVGPVIDRTTVLLGGSRERGPVAAPLPGDGAATG